MRALGIMALLGVAALTGCVSWVHESPPAVAPMAEQLDPAEARLVEAAERAERALASLARALPPPDAASTMPAPDAVPEALMRTVSIDWTGPLPALAEELARRAGYRFVQAGRPPARPLIVAIEAAERPLLAVLRDAGLRAGGVATLTVDAAGETIVLDWTGPARTPQREDG